MAERARRAGLGRVAAVFPVLAGLLGGAAAADQLALPPAIERSGTIDAAYRFDQPVTGHGFLDVEWTDSAGRVVEQDRIPLKLAGASEAVFPLDMRRAVTIENRLAARLSLDGVDSHGGPVHRDNEESVSFIASPPDHPWRDYQIIMWQGQPAAGYAALKRLGITAGMVEANHRSPSSTHVAGQLAPLLDQDLGFYLENIATDFYSPYHRWSGDRPVDWRFTEVEERYRRNPGDITAFFREPSLSDPLWLKRIADRLDRDVRALHPYRPLYYSLADETGIAELSAPWDFDFSGDSLTAMRSWLKERYGSLDALNREWGSAFARWEAVVPMTTSAAMARADQNFSAWADFKEWMDVAFARALKAGTDAVHAADPDAVSAIEGAQIPGWGGYDYSRLADSVDAMELYDYGENVEIVRSFNPRMITLTTSFRGGPAETHRVWRELLRGTRGLVLWDEKHEFAGADGDLGDRGREAASYFGEIRGGIGALLINTLPHDDPIGVLYSPASMRVQWLLDRRASGEDWTRRDASAEYRNDPIRISTQAFIRTTEHAGLQPRFVSARAIGTGALRSGDYRILMLPGTIALSPDEAREIRDFVAKGGVAIAYGEPGVFDGHGRRAAKSLLSDLFPSAAAGTGASVVFGKGKAFYLPTAHSADRGDVPEVAAILTAAGVTSPFPLTGADGGRANDVETHVFDDGKAAIVALQRDLPAPAGIFSAFARPDSTEAVVVTLPHPLYVYDIRARLALGRTDRLALALGPVEPILLAMSEAPFGSPSLAGPAAAHAGATVEFLVHTGFAGGFDVIHFDVVDPDGHLVAHYSGNVLVRRGVATRLLPLAVNDEAGTWKIRARDLLGGATATRELTVQP